MGRCLVVCGGPFRVGRFAPRLTPGPGQLGPSLMDLRPGAGGGSVLRSRPSRIQDLGHSRAENIRSPMTATGSGSVSLPPQPVTPMGHAARCQRRLATTRLLVQLSAKVACWLRGPLAPGVSLASRSTPSAAPRSPTSATHDIDKIALRAPEDRACYDDRDASTMSDDAVHCRSTVELCILSPNLTTKTASIASAHPGNVRHSV